MGGGDLNLKKSWHPLTMKNLERVWKAEQRHDAEQKRIQELQAEIKEERARQEVQQMAIDAGVMKKKDDRVDWLYKGPGTINREEYLLGKPIDKAIDPTLIEEEMEKEALANEPGALFLSSGSGIAGTVADLEVKIREDPLFLIKKNEEEAKKRLLDNPIKLQQLQKIIQKSKSKKKHKHKSEKKSKKARHHSDDSSDSESESDIRQRRRHKEDRRGDASPDISRHKRIGRYNRDDDDDDGHSRNRHRRPISAARRTDDNDLERHRKYSPDNRRSRHRERNRSPIDNRRERYRSPLTRRDSDKSPPRRNRERSPARDRSPIGRSYRHSEGTSRRNDQQPSGGREGSRNARGGEGSNVTRKMDQQELERKRQEMMSSAKERDEEREMRFKRHKEALEKEEAEAIKHKGNKDDDFLKSMKVQSLTSSGSLEDRIHRNINSVQRTRAALNDNFLKR